MIFPVRLTNEMSASGRGGRRFVLAGGQHEALFGSGRGADDENPTSSGGEVTVVAGRRDCGGELSDDAALAWRYQQHGYDGLYDRRRGKPSPKRVPLETVEQVLQLYRQQYADRNLRHFHQKLIRQHAIR